MIKVIFISLFLIIHGSVIAQQGTDIFLCDLVIKDNKVTVSNPRNITQRKGYDNQPFFHPKRSILYYVSADSSGQTDIFEFDYQSNHTASISSSPEREYSPTVMPDWNYLSCIIQLPNGAQNLGRYHTKGGIPVTLIDNLTVGYHAWTDMDNLFLFTLPAPFALHWINISKKTDRVITEDIGRSLHKIPGENALSFVQKSGADWWIKKLEVESGTISNITKSISLKDHDMAWTYDGKIMMSNGAKLYFYKRNSEWMEVQLDDLPPDATISRLAVNNTGDKIAIVINE
jgi:hypothetical protein